MKIYKNTQYTAVSLLMVVMAFTSCNKFIDIDPPRTELIRATVFESDATAISAQSAIYSQMANDLTYNFSSKLVLSADEWNSLSTDQWTLEMYQNALTPQNIYISSYIWNPMYRYVYLANSVLEGLEESKTVSAAVKQQLQGEAKFIRAFCYFYLTNLFGEVPLVTTSDYKANALAERNSVDDVYAGIIDDLEEAKSLLSDDYLTGDLASVTGERARPNKMVATALLARVYLYREQYDNAYEMSNEVINDSHYELDSLENVFLTTSKEAIWQLNSPYNTYEARSYILYSIPSYPYYGSLSESFLAKFETNDKRFTEWIGVYSEGGTDYHYPYKYKNDDFFGDVTEYQTVLRLAEQYLIRAEAQANGAGGGIDAAIDDLNEVRKRAWLPGYAGPAAKEPVVDAVMREREAELFTEWGHRWLDLKRSDRVDAVMSVVSPQKGGTAWDSDQQLYPIPQAEREKNINLSQNDGYQ